MTKSTTPNDSDFPIAVTFGMHEPGCTKEAPCKHCLVSRKLQELLGWDDFVHFLTRFGGLQALTEQLQRRGSIDIELPLMALQLSDKTERALGRDGIDSIKHLLLKSKTQIRHSPGISRAAIKEIEAALAGVGHTLV